MSPLHCLQSYSNFTQISVKTRRQHPSPTLLSSHTPSTIPSNVYPTPPNPSPAPPSPNPQTTLPRAFLPSPLHLHTPLPTWLLPSCSIVPSCRLLRRPPLTCHTPRRRHGHALPLRRLNRWLSPLPIPLSSWHCGLLGGLLVHVVGGLGAVRLRSVGGLGGGHASVSILLGVILRWPRQKRGDHELGSSQMVETRNWEKSQ